MQVDDDASGPRSSQLVHRLQILRQAIFGDEDGDDDFQTSPAKAIAAAVSDFNKCNKSILPPSKSVLIPSPPSTEDVVPPQVLVAKVVEVNTPPKKTSEPLIFKGRRVFRPSFTFIFPHVLPELTFSRYMFLTDLDSTYRYVLYKKFVERKK